jgi:DNA-binding MarR family transcriptional regulator
MRRQTVRNEVIANLADQHYWTIGELADTIDVYRSSVRRVVADLEKRGFVKRFDDEKPAMFGWFTAEDPQR